MKSVFVTYLLWLPGFLGLAGLHRFYLGKPITGIIWLLTVGLFFFGTLYDLFSIPGQVKLANLQSQAGNVNNNSIQNTIVVNVQNGPAPKPDATGEAD